MYPYLINTVIRDRKVTTLNISLLIKKDLHEKSLKWSLKKLTQSTGKKVKLESHYDIRVMTFFLLDVPT